MERKFYDEWGEDIMKLKEILNTFIKDGEDSYYYESDVNGPRYSLSDIMEMNLRIYSSASTHMVLLSIYPSDNGKYLCVDVEKQ